MKTFIAFALVLAVSQTALAQSRGGNAGWIGNLKQGGKTTVASGKDLERAQRYAQQAQKRLGGTSRSSGGWATGGSGWQTGGSANRR